MKYMDSVCDMWLGYMVSVFITSAWWDVPTVKCDTVDVPYLTLNLSLLRKTSQKSSQPGRLTKWQLYQRYVS